MSGCDPKNLLHVISLHFSYEPKLNLYRTTLYFVLSHKETLKCFFAILAIILNFRPDIPFPNSCSSVIYFHVFLSPRILFRTLITELRNLKGLIKRIYLFCLNILKILPHEPRLQLFSYYVD